MIFLKVIFKDYARYVLKEGTMTEQREFMGCIKSKFVITKKVVALEKQKLN
ncbi:MAG: hypothetical protein HY433_00265 [Candidatus Liptonbacteria bacterium]|nr:hypothetical protein [Candidatus Liptonbacteria bacterium]